MFISVIIVTITTIIPHFISLIEGGNDARINSILSIIGNISGGLIAGVVAYITAKYQVDKIEKQNKDKEIKVSLTELKFIRQELVYNLNVFRSTSHDDKPDKQAMYLSSQLKVSTWDNTNLNFVNYIHDKLLERLFNYYNLLDFVIKNKTIGNIDESITLNEKLVEQVTNKIEQLNDGNT